MASTNPSSPGNPDVVLIGAGIMSATLAVFLKELQPDLKIQIFERLATAAEESSNAWNNAGTGHAALCELNYTPQRSDGSIDISKGASERSRQHVAIVERFVSLGDVHRRRRQRDEATDPGGDGAARCDRGQIQGVG
jgi:glycine/D-amino acid oxidase-like deaminating enzyme